MMFDGDFTAKAYPGCWQAGNQIKNNKLIKHLKKKKTSFYKRILLDIGYSTKD